jgi:hypothetical protein
MVDNYRLIIANYPSIKINENIANRNFIINLPDFN